VSSGAGLGWVSIAQQVWRYVRGALAECKLDRDFLPNMVSTHHVVTTLLPAADGRTLAIRRGSAPGRRTGEMYRLLMLDP